MRLAPTPNRRGGAHRRTLGAAPFARPGRPPVPSAVVASQQDLTLGAEFPTPTRDQWLQLVDKVLGGAPFDRSLVTRTADGLRLEPLYTADDLPGRDPGGLPGLSPYTRGRTAGRRVVEGWDVRQLYAQPSLEAANEAILADLERGATSLWLRIGDGALPVTSADDLDRLLDGVHLDLAPVVLDAGAEAVAAAGWLAEVWARRDVPASAALAQLGVDPLAEAARRGGPVADGALEALGRTAAQVAVRHPQVVAGRVDATAYADAGATAPQELAYALATGVAYLRALVAAGLGADEACGQLAFQLTANADQFTTVAKLRAARRCWARVAEVCGASEAARGARLDVVTAAAMLSRRDPWVNLLRATLATFAAGVAAADSITVLPFDWAIGQPDDLGRRLARNTHTILLEESNLARVVDPGGGSYFVESLTETLAQEAWQRFQAIEEAGGMAQALASGAVAAEVADAWEARLAALATRRQPLTGVTEFPDVHEAALARAPRPAPQATGPFPLRRHAAPFEELRDAADRATPTPQVFLANLGPIATHTARAGFARNLFEVGGIRALGNDGFPRPAEAAEAFARSGARLAVICSSDAVYAEHAEEAARLLKAAGAARVYLAGNPGERRQALEAAGVDEFVALGCDVLDVLRRALDTLGVAP